MRQMSEAKGKTLVNVARAAITRALGGPDAADPAGDWLAETAATFVTLTRHGQLHGCIGSIEARRSLIEDVKQNAVAAALRDPRATYLTLESVVELRVEISLLSPLEPIAFASEDEALAALRPHVDGVVLLHGGRRATFLPQVWESLSTCAEFLAHLKQKAGLPAHFWSPDVQLFRYSLEKWEEEPGARKRTLG
jgi:AmmeMemoRadiSam system protein A